MASEDINQFPVVEDGRLMGMVARDALVKFIALRSELQAWGAPGRTALSGSEP